MQSEPGLWARAAIESGLLDGHPTEIDVRGSWGMAAYWMLGDRDQAWRAVGDHLPRISEERRSTFPVAWFMTAQARGDQEALDDLLDRWEQLNKEPPLGLASMVRQFSSAVTGLSEDFEAIEGEALAAAEQLGSCSWLAAARNSSAIRCMWTDPARVIPETDRALHALVGLGSFAESHFSHEVAVLWRATAVALTRSGIDALPAARRVFVSGLELQFAHWLVAALRIAALALSDRDVSEAETAALALGAIGATGHVGFARSAHGLGRRGARAGGARRRGRCPHRSGS